MRKHTMYQRWYVYTLLLTFAVVVSLAAFISRQSEKTYDDYRDSIDTLGMSQAANMFNLLDLTARDIALKVYNHPSTVLLSLSPSIDKVSPEFISSFLRLQDMTLPFVHSINVVHIATGNLITTNKGWSQVREDLLDDIKRAYPEIPRVTPLPLYSKVSYDNRHELVFAYIVTESPPEDWGRERAVILLVEARWFLEALALSNDANTGTRFLLHHPGIGILGSVPDGEQENLREELSNQNLIKEAGSFEVSTDNGDYIGEYVQLARSDIRLIRLRDRAVLRRRIVRLRIMIAVVVVVFLVLISLFGVYTSTRIYRPFFSMVADIRDTIGNRIELPEKDFDLLSSIYSSIRNEFAGTGEDRIAVNYLRSLIFEGSLDMEDATEIMVKRGFCISEDNHGALMCFSIDDEDAGDEIASVKYQLREVSAEILRHQRVMFNSFFVRKDLLIVFAVSDPTVPEPKPPWEIVAEELWRKVSALLKTPVSLAIQHPVVLFDQIHDLYPRLLGLLRQRYLRGNGSLLLPDVHGAGKGKPENTLIASLRNDVLEAFRERGEIQDSLDAYIEKVRSLSVDLAQDEANGFALSLARTLSEIDPGFQAQDFVKACINQSTLDGVKTVIAQVGEEWCGRSSALQTETKYSVLISAVRDLVDQRFSDPGLSVQQVADEVHMNANYFGMIFRQNVGSSFAEYLTMVRMQEAAKFLSDTKLTVQEIIMEVGIPSESTFFRRFREYFHVTPQNYRVQQASRTIKKRP